MSREKMNVTERIARFAVTARTAAMPRGVRETAKEHLLDGIATILGGASEEASRQIRRYAAGLGGKAEAGILGARLQAPARYAALANGVQGHVLDYDDAQLATSKNAAFGQLTHPTTPVLAAVLALAEKHSSSGSDLLAAYIVGVEVACRLADAIDPRHYLDGFHPTGTIGVFGAAAASSRLLELDVLHTEQALGIAATLSAGIRAHRGTMAKSLNAGRAAENGVVAAELARAGFTAARGVFEAPMGYFSAAARNNVNRRRLGLGRPFFFAAPGIAIKRYPSAGVLHPALDLIIELVTRRRIAAGAVKSVRVAMGPVAAAPLVYDRPATALEAKFSLPFSAAVAVLERRAGLEQYTDEKVRDPAIADMMRKVEFSRNAALEKNGRDHPRANIQIRLRDGTSHGGETTLPKGHPLNPLSRRELEEKMRECAGRCLEPRAIQRMIDRVWSIESVPSVPRMMAGFRKAFAAKE